jgi:hypothetical protein
MAYEHLIDSLPIDDLEQYEPRSDAMYASYGVSDASEVFLQLAKQTVFHAISRNHRNNQVGPRQPNAATPLDSVAEMATFMARYSEDRFAGILIDTGAAIRSTVGLGQFKAL